jgi:hypothetical protein
MTSNERNPMNTFIGYSVEKHPDDTGLGNSPAYILRGPRGAVYGLIRSARKPEAMYAVNLRRFGIVSLKGNGWFTDRDGELTVW